MLTKLSIQSMNYPTSLKNEIKHINLGVCVCVCFPNNLKLIMLTYLRILVPCKKGLHNQHENSEPLRTKNYLHNL